jgi:hypothetical protein
MGRGRTRGAGTRGSVAARKVDATMRSVACLAVIVFVMGVPTAWAEGGSGRHSGVVGDNVVT